MIAAAPPEGCRGVGVASEESPPETELSSTASVASSIIRDSPQPVCERTKMDAMMRIIFLFICKYLKYFEHEVDYDKLCNSICNCMTIIFHAKYSNEFY